ncbi:MAG TPA: MlaE family lipid ABC transporter permease subunit [Methylovirgula sp.]|nr:MlaE family lipid ABC transporter permease subunit [Methylovirgula sp.]
MPQAPRFSSSRTADALRFSLAGSWTIDAAQILEANIASLVAQAQGWRRAIFDLSGLERLDTSGAWLIDRTRQNLKTKGVETRLEHVRPEYEILLAEAHYRAFPQLPRRHKHLAFEIAADVGESIVATGRDIFNATAFLGEVVTCFLKTLIAPARFRGTSVIFHLENFAFRSMPIIALINFLVGGIVAQRGIYLLQRFGAPTYAVDLVGILVLRELSPMLTAIMIAGRSGSAITAELGSMKMREEVDALHVMGLRPVEVLVVPRLLALILSLPILTIVADSAALFGGLLVAWGYGGISPESFMNRLQNAVETSDFWVGVVKGPFMGLVIGLIAATEGFAVAGSAESLGRQVTASVVKAIFMVIVVDGIFSLFFTSIHF